jgi:hypothetical protein
MGLIDISMQGSFRKKFIARISAEEGGHAFAIQRAVEGLIEVLPDAIQQDHDLDRTGNRPTRADYGKTAEQE